MATTFLKVSSNSLGISVPNNQGVITNYYDSQAASYNATRSYGSRSGYITASLPTGLDNVTVNSVVVNYNSASSGGSYWRSTSSESIVNKLNTDGTVEINWVYAPSSDSASFPTLARAQAYITAGTSTKSLSITNITIEIDYSEESPVQPGTLSYQVPVTSLAQNESMRIVGTYEPVSNIAANDLRVKIIYQPSGTEETVLANAVVNDGIEYTSGANYTFSTPITLLDIAQNYTDDVYICFYTDDETVVKEKINLVCITARQAPIFSSGSTMSFNKAAYLSGVENIIVNFTGLQCDSNTDATISQIQIVFGSNDPIASIIIDKFDSESTQTNLRKTLEPINVSQDITLTPREVIITDSYAQTTTGIVNTDIAASAIAINKYTPPSFGSNFSFKRYVINSVTQEPEPNVTGTSILIDGDVYISGASTVKLMTISYNDTTINVNLSNVVNDKKTFDNDTSILSGEFAQNRSHSFTIILTDDYQSASIDIEVTRTSGYFNIEKGGVSVGGPALGTLEAPRFECYYPMYLVSGGLKYKVTTLSQNGSIFLVLDSDSKETIDPGDEPQFVPTILYSNSTGTSNGSKTAITYSNTEDDENYTIDWVANPSSFSCNNTLGNPSLNDASAMRIYKQNSEAVNHFACIRTSSYIYIPEGYDRLIINVNYTASGSNNYVGCGIIDPLDDIHNCFDSTYTYHGVYAGGSNPVLVSGTAEKNITLDISTLDTSKSYHVAVVMYTRMSGNTYLRVNSVSFSKSE